MIIKTYIPLPIDIWQGKTTAEDNALDIFYLSKNDSKISHTTITSFNEVEGDCVIVVPDIFISIHSFDLPYNNSTKKALPSLLSERILSPITDVIYKDFNGADGKLSAWVLDKLYYDKIKVWTENNGSKVHSILPYCCVPDLVKNMVHQHEFLYGMYDENRNLSELNNVKEWNVNLIKFAKFGMENISYKLKNKTKTFLFMILLIITATAGVVYYSYQNVNKAVLDKGNLIYKMLMQEQLPNRSFKQEYSKLEALNNRYNNYKQDTVVDNYIYVLLKAGGVDNVLNYTYNGTYIKFVYQTDSKDKAYALLDTIKSEGRFSKVNVKELENQGAKFKYEFRLDKK